MKYARWVTTRIHGATISYKQTLRAGEKGTGQSLGAVVIWTDSRISVAEGARICKELEEKARAAGYHVLPVA